MKSLLFYCFVLLLFFSDLIIRTMTHQLYLQSMLALFCIILFGYHSMCELIVLFLFIIVEDFIDIHLVSINLLYSLPLALAGLSLQKLLHPNSLLMIYSFFIISLVCKFSLLAYFNNFQFYKICTLYELSANLILLTLYLKLLFKGRLGSRL